MRTWDFRNDLLSYDQSIADLGDERIIERPKVIYNKQTEKYVMWMHVDSSDYGDARAGVATSDSLCGDYSYIGSERPLDNIARDMTLFVDDDDVAYLIAEDREEGTHFFQLSDDYLTIESNFGTIPFSHTPALESPAVFKVGEVYYFLGSRLTGWDPVSSLKFERETNGIGSHVIIRMKTNIVLPPISAGLGRTPRHLHLRVQGPALLRQRSCSKPRVGITCTWATVGWRTTWTNRNTSGSR